MDNPESPKYSRDTLEGKARDGEPLGTKENLLCSGQKTPSDGYREGWERIWGEDYC